MGKPTSFRPTDDNDEWLRMQAGEQGVTPYLNSLCDLVRTGQLVPKSPDATGKDKDALAKELLTVTIAIKKGMLERQTLENTHLAEKIRNLKLRNDRMEHGNGGYVAKSASLPTAQVIKQEVEKDTASPTFNVLPKGWWKTKCSKCGKTTYKNASMTRTGRYGKYEIEFDDPNTLEEHFSNCLVRQQEREDRESIKPAPTFASRREASPWRRCADCLMMFSDRGIFEKHCLKRHKRHIIQAESDLAIELTHAEEATALEKQREEGRATT